MIQGYKNEYEFCEVFHDKFVYQLEDCFIELLEKIFSQKLDSRSYIICWKSFQNDKADIVIRVGNIKKYLSIKSGKNNSVHLESLKDFKNFLTKIGFSQELIKIYENYHYATDTEGNRVSAKDYQVNHMDEIEQFNAFANKKEIIQKVIERFLLKGKHEENHLVDAIIYGTVHQFFCLTNEEIYNYLQNNSDTFPSIHFSSLTLQPWARNLNFNPSYEYRRDYVQVKWYRLAEVIEHIEKTEA